MSEKLQEAIFPYCDEKEDWLIAREEWRYLGRIENGERENVCACGKKHIKKLHLIEHKRTGITRIIGSECVYQFNMVEFCERCGIYKRPSKTSKYCQHCRGKNRIEKIVKFGMYSGEDYDDAFAQDRANIKWELEKGIYNRDKHYTQYLKNKLEQNADDFDDIEPVKPNYKLFYRNYRLSFGRYKGMTYETVSNRDRQYCSYIVREGITHDVEFYYYCRSVLGV